MINRRDALVSIGGGIVGIGVYGISRNVLTTGDKTAEIMGKYSKANIKKSELAPEYQEMLAKAKQDFRAALIEFGIDEILIENILNSIVLIDSGDKIGTGFFVSDKTILTAGHVIGERVNENKSDFSNPQNPNNIYDLEGNNYNVEKVYGDSDNDIGCIIVSEKGIGKMGVFKQKLIKDIERLTIGFGGNKGRITKGNTTNTFEGEELGLDEAGKVETLSNLIIGGDSGGPVLDINGNVRSIAVRTYYDPVGDITDKDTGITFRQAIIYGGSEPLNDIQIFLGEQFDDLERFK